MCKYCEIMDMAKALDFAIRDYELNNMIIGPSDVPYIIKTENGKREYWNYMSKASWEQFKDAMTDKHKEEYGGGNGGELETKKTSRGLLPPKMASFGSSSRMIYNLSKEIPGFVFEKIMYTYVGGNANLDGYLLLDNTAVFVEAKCSEIYDTHTLFDISNVYAEVYNHLRNKNKSFDYEPKGSKKQNYFKCTFQYDGNDIKYFDLKQLICHFLGISAALINNKIESNTIKFIYLIFNPNYNTDFSHDAIKKYEKKLKDQYDEAIEEIEKFGDMKWLFDSIMEYQSKRLNRQIVKYNFDFYLTDQVKYQNYLK